MKLRAEDLNRHRSSRRKPPTKKQRPRRLILWLLLSLLVVGGIYLYSIKERITGIPQITTLLEYPVELFQQLNPFDTEPIDNQVNLDDITQDFIAREELQELLNNNFVQLNTKVDTFIAQVEKLQQDVEYVGSLGRSVRRRIANVEEQLSTTGKQVARIERNVNTLTETISEQERNLTRTLARHEKELQDIAVRLEQVDTVLQGEVEQLTSSITNINQQLTTLKEETALAGSTNDAQQQRISSLEQTLSVINSRLIELER